MFNFLQRFGKMRLRGKAILVALSIVLTSLGAAWTDLKNAPDEIQFVAWVFWLILVGAALVIFVVETCIYIKERLKPRAETTDNDEGVGSNIVVELFRDIFVREEPDQEGDFDGKTN